METKMNDSYGLAEKHEYILKSLINLDQICKRHNICYSLHGGTMLGAERDGHFIPWDDDADISMMRAQFEAFKSVIENEDSGFKIVEGDPEAPYVTRIIDESQVECKCNIDVFIWDYVTSNRIGQFIKINYIRLLQGTLKGNIRYSDYHGMNKLIVMFTHVLGIPFTKRFKLKNYTVVSKRFMAGDKKCIHRSNDAYVGVGYIFDSDYMKRYSNLTLEGYEFMVSSRYHEFLERNYGKNYLIPPKESDRAAEHSSIHKNFIPEKDKKKRFGILR